MPVKQYRIGPPCTKQQRLEPFNRPYDMIEDASRMFLPNTCWSEFRDHPRRGIAGKHRDVEGSLPPSPAGVLRRLRLFRAGQGVFGSGHCRRRSPGLSPSDRPGRLTRSGQGRAGGQGYHQSKRQRSPNCSMERGADPNARTEMQAGLHCIAAAHSNTNPAVIAVLTSRAEAPIYRIYCQRGEVGTVSRTPLQMDRASCRVFMRTAIRWSSAAAYALIRVAGRDPKTRFARTSGRAATVPVEAGRPVRSSTRRVVLSPGPLRSVPALLRSRGRRLQLTRRDPEHEAGPPCTRWRDFASPLQSQSGIMASSSGDARRQQAQKPSGQRGRRTASAPGG